MATTLSSTFHSFAYGLVRRYAAAELYAAPLRLLSAPEQDVVLQELLDRRTRVGDLAGLAAPGASAPAASPREVHAVLGPGPREGAGGPTSCAGSARARRRRSTSPPGCSWSSTSTSSTHQSAVDYADLIAPRGRSRPSGTATSCAPGSRHVFVDEYQDTDPGQVRAAAGAGRRRPRPHRRRRPPPVDLRLPRRRRARHPRLPGAVPAPRRRAAPTSSPLRTTPPVRRRACCSPRSGSPAGCRWPAASTPDAQRAFLAPAPVADGLPARPGRGAAPSTPSGPRPSTSPTCSAAPTSRTASPGPTWRCWSAPGRASHPGAAPVARRGRRPGRGGRRRHPAGARARGCCRCSTRCGRSVDCSTATSRCTTDVGPPRRCCVSPLGGLDATELRALARALRARERATAGERRARRPSCCATRCSRPRRRGRSPGSGRRRPASVRAAGRAAAPGPGPARRRRHRRGGALGAVGGHRLAAPGCARAVERRRPAAPGWPTATSTRRARCSRRRPAPRSSAATPRSRDFLATLVAQQIPADTLAERGVRGDAVRLLTAHRSKGLEWRARGRRARAGGRLARPAPPLHAARRPTGSAPTACCRRSTRARRCSPRSAGCSTSPCTRARERLVVTAVASPDDDGEQPSRFLAELGVDGAATCRAGRRRPLSMAGLVAELRRTVADPRSPSALRARGRRAGSPGCAAPSVGGRAAGAAGRPRRRGGAPARRPAPTSRSRPDDAPVAALGERADRARSPARPGGSSSARPAAPPQPDQPPGLRQRRARARRRGSPTASCRRRRRPSTR